MKRNQVLIDESEYRGIQRIAHGRGMTLAEVHRAAYRDASPPVSHHQPVRP